MWATTGNYNVGYNQLAVVCGPTRLIIRQLQLATTITGMPVMVVLGACQGRR